MEVLARFLGPFLSNLSLAAPPYTVPYTRHANYGRHHGGPILPSLLFESFPLLHHLSLSSVKDMKIEHLEALLAHSPAIVSLKLHRTVWDFAGLHYDLLEREFEAVLSKWKLGEAEDDRWDHGAGTRRRLHLGLLPIRAEVGLPKLEEAMRHRNIQFKWEGRLTETHEDDW